MNRILTGLRVIESSAFIAAPYAGMTLAQLGADVIRVDPPGGGLDYRRWPVTDAGASLYWAGLNKAKRSVCVDIRKPEGRDLLAALITAPGETGGIFLTNLPAPPPLDYDTLCARRADLIMASIYGNRDGTTAVDYTVNAAIGFPLVTGPEHHDGPVNNVVPAWDLLAGVNIALAILAAERHRRMTRQGQLLRLALSDMALATVGNLGYIAEAQMNGSDRPRLGNSIYGTFGRDFETADGARVMVVAFTVKQWESLVAATETGGRIKALEAALKRDLRKETDRYETRADIAAILEPWFRSSALADIRAALDAQGACWGPYQSFGQLVESDPRCSTANPLLAEIEQPGIGRHLMPGHPVDFGAMERQKPAPAPALGCHTDEVLASVLGLDGHQIGKLRDRGIVRGPD
jgi:2-methylfumaryl-CoA isomerase